MSDEQNQEPEEPKSEEEASMDEGRMTLFEHLAELRQRLRNAFIAFITAMILAYVFVERIFELLTRPVRQGLKNAGLELRFIITNPTEMFWVYFKLAIVAGILISAPFVFWELWKFIAPGLYKKEKRLALIVVGATGACFTLGAVFGYMFLTEPAITFLSSFIIEKFNWAPTDIDMHIENMFRVQEVVEFEVMMLLGCGVAFELPVVLSVLGWLGIVSASGLWKFNKYALVLSALLGGILTPGGDPVSQLLLAGPIFFLYNLSILVVKAIEKARKQKLDDIDKQYETPDGAA